MVNAGILPFRENSHSRARNRTRDLKISRHRLWPLDHEAGHTSTIIKNKTITCSICNQILSMNHKQLLYVISTDYYEFGCPSSVTINRTLIISVVTPVTLIYERWFGRSKLCSDLSENAVSLVVGPMHSATIVPPPKSSALLLNQSTARLINIWVVKVVKENEAWICIQRVIDEEIFSEIGDFNFCHPFPFCCHRERC